MHLALTFQLLWAALPSFLTLLLWCFFFPSPLQFLYCCWPLQWASSLTLFPRLLHELSHASTPNTLQDIFFNAFCASCKLFALSSSSLSPSAFPAGTQSTLCCKRWCVKGICCIWTAKGLPRTDKFLNAHLKIYFASLHGLLLCCGFSQLAFDLLLWQFRRAQWSLNWFIHML